MYDVPDFIFFPHKLEINFFLLFAFPQASLRKEQDLSRSMDWGIYPWLCFIIFFIDLNFLCSTLNFTWKENYVLYQDSH